MIDTMIKTLFQSKAILLDNEDFFKEAAEELRSTVKAFLDANKGGGNINMILTDSNGRYFEFEITVIVFDTKVSAVKIGVTELTIDEALDRMAELSRKHEHHHYYKPEPKS